MRFKELKLRVRKVTMKVEGIKMRAWRSKMRENEGMGAKIKVRKFKMRFGEVKMMVWELR